LPTSASRCEYASDVIAIDGWPSVFDTMAMSMPAARRSGLPSGRAVSRVQTGRRRLTRLGEQGGSGHHFATTVQRRRWLASYIGLRPQPHRQQDTGCGRRRGGAPQSTRKSLIRIGSSLPTRPAFVAQPDGSHRDPESSRSSLTAGKRFAATQPELIYRDPTAW
jgi:hypothetical protein